MKNEQIPIVVNRADDGSGGWSLHLDLAGHEDDEFLCAGSARWIRGTGRWSRPSQKDLSTARRVARQRISGIPTRGIDLD